jgi:hypothetical protein
LWWDLNPGHTDPFTNIESARNATTTIRYGDQSYVTRKDIFHEIFMKKRGLHKKFNKKQIFYRVGTFINYVRHKGAGASQRFATKSFKTMVLRYEGRGGSKMSKNCVT